ncbi:condensation protein [Streptomyces sp. NPDC090442]|uniref:condensation protein n=1 Tax=Streptomyces sp. NPDC090442 TaxID=3365962 RepID=UPI00382B6230
MTALQPARHDPPDGRDTLAREGRAPTTGPGPTPRVRFPLVDEISRHCLEDDEPETVHVEVHLPGRLDHARLRTAFHRALARHPRVLMRQAPARWWHRHYRWQLTPTPDTDPVVFPPPGPDALTRARDRALTDCPPLDAAPPLRLEVIEPTHPTTTDVQLAPPQGTVLLLTAHHTALDGPAALRILATTAELYGHTRPSPLTTPPPHHTPRLSAPLPHHNPLTRPTHIAPSLLHQHPTNEPTKPTKPTTKPRRSHTPLPGNGMLLIHLPLPTRPPHPAGTPAPYTINDQLLVATYLMTTRWNAQHNHPTAPVVIAMPIDDRPRGPRMPIGNGTRLAPVHFPSPPRATAAPTPSRLLHQTAAHTRALKSTPSPQLGLAGTLLTALPLPIGARRALTRALRALATPWAPTALLSNIGRVPYPLDFGDEGGRATAVWFSAPARMPRGLSVTAAATSGGDRIHLALRWSRALLDDAAAARLLDLFRSSLATTARPPEPEANWSSPEPTWPPPPEADQPPPDSTRPPAPEAARPTPPPPQTAWPPPTPDRPQPESPSNRSPAEGAGPPAEGATP